ncbi:MAG: cytochrome C [Acidobacteria bacterium]|nr:MAG: cytochrome C [Acidobacteriota bacterium]
MTKVKRILKWLLLAAVIVVVVMQFFGPKRTNPTAEASLALESHAQVPANVKAVLDRSCADCHSNNTRWPWYSRVAPVSWFVIDHVNDGREQLNLSEWGRYDKRQQSHNLDDMCELATEGDMPLSSYTPLHPGSKPTADDIKILCDWTNAEQARLALR